ncbi:Holliday junction branch migration protein RuvA [Candidatus Peregrinibacteria bacterium]|jgi:Holliday junction DNA helicase RuvA|nr:Holliday junction branch migration protein RuvA [Candidatus Peregrinibacteria bacterium]MBT3598926.1 Holliday junction branch migration protein RuvA [Candidatus Peregrinibacteria bacterium]MBT6730742.1 Holliday junction branch migration protein RuvA [Candidatus Peregrinibacteria bacterium]MBT7009432.1 Holliday junction branch migration protein RuvA [Candidatus Peregrinibacteria bacterium]MBT7344750.1 Holliday junction branch migration protein RuvA [Candidatus Peregrinibacteria bacterium]
MISHLHGTVKKLKPGVLSVDVSNVGYLLNVPLDVWDGSTDEIDATFFVYTYVREDRLELFGFIDWSSRMLFAHLVKMSGIGPSLALELCSVPRNMLGKAISEQDCELLTSIKGIGKKRAEKLLLELKSLLELIPGAFTDSNKDLGAQYDKDAMDALKVLGYDSPTIISALKEISPDLKSTEERVTAALRSL